MSSAVWLVCRDASSEPDLTRRVNDPRQLSVSINVHMGDIQAPSKPTPKHHATVQCREKHSFYPHNTMLAWVLAMALCLSVCHKAEFYQSG